MLRDCLRSLPDATAGITWEAWVVDNNSPDQSARMVAEEFPHIHLMANDRNAGFTRANNQALQQAKSRHAVILNPDTECRSGSLSTMVRYLDTHSDVGAIGPKLLNTDGTLQPNGSRFPSPLQDFLVVSELRWISKSAFERRSRMRDDFEIE